MRDVLQVVLVVVGWLFVLTILFVGILAVTCAGNGINCNGPSPTDNNHRKPRLPPPPPPRRDR